MFWWCWFTYYCKSNHQTKQIKDQTRRFEKICLDAFRSIKIVPVVFHLQSDIFRKSCPDLWPFCLYILRLFFKKWSFKLMRSQTGHHNWPGPNVFIRKLTSKFGPMSFLLSSRDFSKSWEKRGGKPKKKRPTLGNTKIVQIIQVAGSVGCIGGFFHPQFSAPGGWIKAFQDCMPSAAIMRYQAGLLVTLFSLVRMAIEWQDEGFQKFWSKRLVSVLFIHIIHTL